MNQSSVTHVTKSNCRSVGAGLFRTLTLALALVLAACGNEDQLEMRDSGTDSYAPIDYPPEIDWAQWGADCDRPGPAETSYGTYGCSGLDQTPGTCVVDWHGRETCRHACYSNPPWSHECPVGAIAIHDGYHSQGCYCARLPL